jgi:hypothetical protein
VYPTVAMTSVHERPRPAHRLQRPGPSGPEPRQLPGMQLTDPDPVSAQRSHAAILERPASSVDQHPESRASGMASP